jgi:hypothetical protein
MKKLFFAVVFLGIAMTSVHADTSEWMSGYQAYKAWFKQKRHDYTLMAIECRDTGETALDVGKFEYRVTAQKLDKPVKYLWAIGSSFGRYESIAKKKGYTRVSYSSFRRKKSGLLVRCGVWQKK